MIVVSSFHKVWYHKCESRGRNCKNTKLLGNGGCTIWYDEIGVRNFSFIYSIGYFVDTVYLEDF